MKKHLTILIVLLVTTSFLGCVNTVDDEPIIPRDNGLAGIDSYRSLWKWEGNPVSGYDPQGFAWAQCTSYAAFAIREHTPHNDFSNSWKGLHFGNAAEWHIAAKKAGIRVDKTPAVGAVAHNEYDYAVRRGFGSRKGLKVGKDFDNILHFEKRG